MRGRPATYGSDYRDRAAILRTAGKSYRAIALALGVCVGTVVRLLKSPADETIPSTQVPVGDCYADTEPCPPTLPSEPRLKVG